METTPQRLETLFRAYLENRITEAEYQEFWQLLEAEAGRHALKGDLEALWESVQEDRPQVSPREWEEGMSTLIRQAETENRLPAPRRSAWLRWAGAAAAVLFLGVAGYLYLHRPAAAPAGAPAVSSGWVPQPGTQKAVLTLADGSAVALDTTGSRTIGRQGGAQVTQVGGGLLSYRALHREAAPPVYNTLSTPRGGTFSLVLPDGTRAWLNAASSLRFPTAFQGDARKVEMTGEVYFEVSANAARPFLVSADGTDIQVLGTHFDVMAYGDEPGIRTTLLEGSVRVTKGSHSLVLAPGQQALISSDGTMTVNRDIDENQVIAWTHNLFWFENADATSLMRQVSRWYNAEVEIRGDIPEHFTGSIPRNVSLSRVFQVLGETGRIHYRVDSGRIIVTP